MMTALKDEKPQYNSNFENQSSKSVVSKNTDIVQEEDKEISDNEDEMNFNEDIKKNKMRRLNRGRNRAYTIDVDNDNQDDNIEFDYNNVFF